MQDKNKKVFLRNMGLVDYKEAWDYQTGLFNEIVQLKIHNRNSPEEAKATPNFLLCCQHPHVYSLGKSGKAANLLISEELLKSKNASYYEINRGGDITYHGPGQIVIYPILDLDNFFTDIHKYMRYLEEAVIRTITSMGIVSGRIEGLTGVWIDCERPERARKICALGVKTSRWVCMHGLALNVNADLSYFNNIVPCGIKDKEVTSISKELGREIDESEVQRILIKNLADLFSMELIADVN